jgi:hypothetical protein
MYEINDQTIKLARRQIELKKNTKENEKELMEIYEKMAELDTEYRYLMRERHNVQLEQRKEFEEKK